MAGCDDCRKAFMEQYNGFGKDSTKDYNIASAMGTVMILAAISGVQDPNMTPEEAKRNSRIAFEEHCRTKGSEVAERYFTFIDGVVYGFNCAEKPPMSPGYAESVLRAVEKGERIPDQTDFETNRALIPDVSSFGAKKAFAQREGKGG